VEPPPVASLSGSGAGVVDVGVVSVVDVGDVDVGAGVVDDVGGGGRGADVVGDVGGGAIVVGVVEEGVLVVEVDDGDVVVEMVVEVVRVACRSRSRMPGRSCAAAPAGRATRANAASAPAHADRGHTAAGR
jgi:hypothetical protein